MPRQRPLIAALLAFVAMPGVVAFAVPALWLAAEGRLRQMQPWGLLPGLPGVIGLLWCARDFYVSGRGTLAPWAPPLRLVVVGLYRHSRNPMYVAVLLILCGWALAGSSAGLGLYALAVGVVFHLRVVLGEEPWLAKTHSQAWADYAARVPRWLF